MLDNWIGVRFWLVALSVMGWATSSHIALAQDIPNRMHIVVEDDDKLIRCGLTKNAIEAVGKASMRYNRIEIVVPDDGLFTLPYIYITVNSLEAMRGSCVSDISVSVLQYDTYPKKDGNFYPGFFEYCSRGSILSGPDHASRVYDAIRQQVDECLGDIRSTEYRSLMRELLDAVGERAKAER